MENELIRFRNLWLAEDQRKSVKKKIIIICAIASNLGMPLERALNETANRTVWPNPWITEEIYMFAICRFPLEPYLTLSPPYPEGLQNS